jgi:hypothetical protein
MLEIPVEIEGVFVLIKKNQNNKDHISFRLRDSKKILPFFVSVTRKEKKKAFVYVQFPQEEASVFMSCTNAPLIEQISEIVEVVLDMVAIQEEKNKNQED